MAAVLAQPGGADAMRLQLGERYRSVLGRLGERGTKVLLPADLIRPDALLQALGIPEESDVYPTHRL